MSGQGQIMILEGKAKGQNVLRIRSEEVSVPKGIVWTSQTLRGNFVSK